MLLVLLLGAALVAEPVPAEVAPVYTLASCADPVARKAMLAADPDDLPAFRAMKQRAAANEERMTLVLDRLAERAKLSNERKAELAMGMVDTPEFKAAFDEGMGLAGKMMRALKAMMESKDDASNCRTVIDMIAVLPAIEANAERQWGAMHKVLESEAKKLGVSLAD